MADFKAQEVEVDKGMTHVHQPEMLRMPLSFRWPFHAFPIML